MRPASFTPADEPFFREYGARQPGLRRSLGRARAFAVRLGLDLDAVPTPLTVVGSKGKGTTATNAAAALAAKGHRVGTVTSPGYRTNRERIRVDGLAISPADYEHLSACVAAALPRREPGEDGYLSPTGLFTVAGVWWLVQAGCDTLVLEAGMGGGSDEVSLFTPSTVAVTRIFDEHVGILGATVAEIAREKAAVVRPETRRVWTITQAPEVAAVLAEVAGDRLRIVPPEEPDIAKQNWALGVVAGVDHTARPVDETRLNGTLATVRLPGRRSVHPRGDGQTWFVDSAIDPVGVRAAVGWCPDPSAVVVAWPDGKRPAANLAALGDLPGPVVPVATENRRLTFTDPVWAGHSPLPVLADLDLDALGPRVLALGTISFVGEVLEALDVSTERSFGPVPPRTATRR